MVVNPLNHWGKSPHTRHHKPPEKLVKSAAKNDAKNDQKKSSANDKMLDASIPICLAGLRAFYMFLRKTKKKDPKVPQTQQIVESNAFFKNTQKMIKKYR